MDREKIITYGSNVLANPIINLVKPFKEALGNPGNLYGGLFYGGLDLASELSPKLKNSAFTGLAKVVGRGVFGIKSIAGFFSVCNGNYDSLIELPFDVSMTYQLGKDTFSRYGEGRGRKDILEDVKKLVPKK